MFYKKPLTPSGLGMMYGRTRAKCQIGFWTTNHLLMPLKHRPLLALFLAQKLEVLVHFKIIPLHVLWTHINVFIVLNCCCYEKSSLKNKKKLLLVYWLILGTSCNCIIFGICYSPCIHLKISTKIANTICYLKDHEIKHKTCKNWIQAAFKVFYNGLECFPNILLIVQYKISQLKK